LSRLEARMLREVQHRGQTQAQTLELELMGGQPAGRAGVGAQQTEEEAR
jgi:hypothetical protein